MVASTLLDLLHYWHDTNGEKNALWWQGEYISYSQLYQQVRKRAEAFSQRYPATERIAVLGFNSPEYVALLYAIPSANHVVLPLNARLSATEWIYQLKQSKAKMLIAEAGLLHRLKADPAFDEVLKKQLTFLDIDQEMRPWLESCSVAGELKPNDSHAPAWMLYTSGSTGHPKAALLSQKNLLAGLDSGAYGRPVFEHDHYLYPFPLFHVAGHNVLLQHQYGACVVLLRGFDAATVMQCCRELKIDTMSLAPTMIAMLLEHPDFSYADLASVRTIGYGASAMPENLLHKLLNNSSVGLCQGYGMTELSGSIAFLTEDDHQQALQQYPQRLKSVGKVVPGISVKITEEGEIAVKAKQRMLAYWHADESIAPEQEQDWFLTGDMGVFDDDGYLYLVDRKKDMIITGGENVASREVESVLLQSPQIKQAAVVATSDDRWGEAVTAFICLATGQATTGEQVKQFSRQYLAAYKVPKYVYFVAALPVNASGKIDKPALREQAEQRKVRD